MARSALCRPEAGRPEHAVELLQQHLANGTFAPRDRGFFTTHLAGSLAAAGEPDQAAATGLSARRPAVRELRQALTRLTV